MAEEKNNDTLRFGSSILVPSVQELAKHPITEIPHRYIRPDLPHHSPISSDASQIPVIDMSNLRSHDTMDSELSRLHSACKNWGFFQVKLKLITVGEARSERFVDGENEDGNSEIVRTSD
uniref:Non-haem dioxygenase N-terminal domain-containing protein n=1 Tax=Cucumis melo TaxID=3656 RepID=A0A9I9CCS3_CUCME